MTAFFKADHTAMYGYKKQKQTDNHWSIEISPCGTIIGREDLKTKHEKADVIAVVQAIYTAEVESKKVFVDDADT